MVIKYRISNQHTLYYDYSWLVRCFHKRRYRKIVIESLAFCQKEKGLVINAYVIMSNHIHLICYTREPYKLSDFLRDFKKSHQRQLFLQFKTMKRKAERNGC